MIQRRSLLVLDTSLSIQHPWESVSTLRKSRTYNTPMTVSQTSAASMSNVKSEACHSPWELRTGKWSDIHFVSVFCKYWLCKVDWWGDGPQFKPKFCKEMYLEVTDPSPVSSIPLQPDFFCPYACPGPTPHIPVSAVCLHPCVSPYPPHPKCSLFPLSSLFLTPHSHRSLPGSWCLLGVSSQVSAASCSWLFAQQPSKHQPTAPMACGLSLHTQIGEKRVSLIPSFQFQIWCHRNFWQDTKSQVCTRGRVFQVTWINFNWKQ